MAHQLAPLIRKVRRAENDASYLKAPQTAERLRQLRQELSRMKNPKTAKPPGTWEMWHMTNISGMEGFFEEELARNNRSARASHNINTEIMPIAAYMGIIAAGIAVVCKVMVDFKNSVADPKHITELWVGAAVTAICYVGCRVVGSLLCKPPFNDMTADAVRLVKEVIGESADAARLQAAPKALNPK